MFANCSGDITAIGSSCQSQIDKLHRRHSWLNSILDLEISLSNEIGADVQKRDDQRAIRD